MSTEHAELMADRDLRRIEYECKPKKANPIEPLVMPKIVEFINKTITERTKVINKNIAECEANEINRIAMLGGILEEGEYIKTLLTETIKSNFSE